MDFDAYFDAELDEHEAVVAATRALKADFIRLAEISEAAINAGRDVLFDIDWQFLVQAVDTDCWPSKSIGHSN